MPTRRDQITERALEYFLDHGVTDFSLRPLAAATGTSARLLVYHFGSKAGLFTAVMDRLRARIQTSFAASAVRGGNASDSFARFWRLATRRAHLRELRLLFEVQVLALQRPKEFSGYVDRTTQTWLSLVLEALPETRRTPALATLCVAVFDGLVLELLSTGDRARTTRAMAMFQGILHGDRMR